MPNGAKNWIFTLNNWTPEEQAAFCDYAALPVVSYLSFGREIAPGTGTPHLQGYIQFTCRKTLEYLKREVSGRAHWLVARGTPKQNKAYVQKDGDYEEFGEISGSKGTSGSLQAAQEWIRHFVEEHGRSPTSREIADEHPLPFISHRRGLLEYGDAIAPHPVLRSDPELREWQSELEDLLEDPADDRTVHFFVDEQGAAGKTFFAQYFMTKFPDNTQILSVGKRDDLAHAIDQHKSIFFIDVPRSQMEFLQYSILEMLKNRLVFSPKYNSMTKTLHKNPHVVVFCNEAPNESKLSADRFNIKYI